MKAHIGLILLITSASAVAQTEKGNFMLGGSVAYSSSTSTSEYYYLNLSPNVSYFVIDRLAMGMVTPLETTKNSTNYSLGPTVRYYFLDGPLRIFPEVTCGWGKNTYSYSDVIGTPFEVSSNSTFYEAGVGLTYLINKNIGVEGVLTYLYNTRTYYLGDPPIIPGGTSTNFRDGTSVIFQIGFQVYLSSRKP